MNRIINAEADDDDARDRLLCPAEASVCLGGLPEIEGVPDAINCLECCFPSIFTLPGACATCGLSDDPAEVTGMDSCLTCEDGYEIGPLYSDCTGLCGNQNVTARPC